MAGEVQLDIKVNAVSIFDTQLSIQANENSSLTAALPHVLTATPLLIADDSLITVDVLNAGVGARGLVVTLIGS
jgi:inosine/xanthosine triphosphate pyrophosphatase family protein